MKRVAISLIILVVLFSCAVQKKEVVTQPTTTAFQDSLAFELCQIYGSDQTMRTWGIKVSSQIDSLNFVKVIEFIKKYGFPSPKNLGANFKKHECVTAAAIVVMLHKPEEIVNNSENKQLLLNEVEKGNLHIKTFLTFLDKYYVIYNLQHFNRQRFYMGSQFAKPCIEDRAISDSLRKDIGLPPLEDEDFRICNE
ncbi:MAG: hypothetical protein FWH23_02595 [Bacteroidales bacterium]|nr:hypothetical protein [Bacteroidales bacterium]